MRLVEERFYLVIRHEMVSTTLEIYCTHVDILPACCVSMFCCTMQSISRRVGIIIMRKTTRRSEMELAANIHKPLANKRYRFVRECFAYPIYSLYVRTYVFRLYRFNFSLGSTYGGIQSVPKYSYVAMYNVDTYYTQSIVPGTIVSLVLTLCIHV